MALTSALLTGLTGLDVNQQWMNVIGNNIANVNTTAFKQSRAVFTPQFYVTDAGATAPDANTGGSNPDQHGLGATVATIQKDFTAGSIQSTGVNTDMAINGSGLFVVNGPQGQSYTRDGAFTLNAANQLVNTGGNFVQGYGVDSTGKVVPGKLQNITIPLGASSTAEATQNVNMQGNFDAGGNVASGASILGTQSLTTVGGGAAPASTTLLTNVASSTDNATPLFTAGQKFTLQAKKGSYDLTPQTFTVSATSTLSDLQTFFQNSMGIDPTISPPAGAPTPGATLKADPNDPNSVQLIVAGNTGTANALQLGAASFRDQTGAAPFNFNDTTDAAGDASNPVGESTHTTLLVFDSLGKPINVDVTAVYQSSSSTGTTWQFSATSADNQSPTGSTIVGGGTLTFDNSGKYVTGTGLNLNINRAGTGAKSPLTVKMDFSGTTALASQSSDIVMDKQDGSPLGSLQSFSVGSDGVITGAFSNGLTRSLGQVALATFNNPQGLDDKGGNLYGGSANSGSAVITQPNELGAGSIQAGALEQSNVDLSKEFTSLIIASTGFSAASRVITTSNQMLTELLNSNR